MWILDGVGGIIIIVQLGRVRSRCGITFLCLGKYVLRLVSPNHAHSDLPPKRSLGKVVA